jgi:hypothetical protein
MDWELHEGLTLRIAEATAAAERDRLVRELRAARRARREEEAGPERGWLRRWRPRGWRRSTPHHLPVR